MSQRRRGEPLERNVIRIAYGSASREVLVLSRSGERLWLDGREFETLRIVEPAGLEAEPLYRCLDQPVEAILSVAFQALAERRVRQAARRDRARPAVPKAGPSSGRDRGSSRPR